MSGAMDVSKPTGASPELAPLRAKSGWIVALGVVYLIAGFIALGSVDPLTRTDYSVGTPVR